jgi:mannose-6-phosphate isomerase
VAKSDLRIDILGTSFSISADEDRAYLESLLNYYRIKIENTRKKTGLQDPLKLALVTGFLLCDDILKGRTGTDQDEAERLTLDLITRIDAALSAGDEAAGTPAVELAAPVEATEAQAGIGTDDTPLAEAAGVPVPLEIPVSPPYRRPFLKLENTVKHYEWGSSHWIPQLLNRTNENGEPWAELWMGAHPAGSSLAEQDGAWTPLHDIIARSPEFYLGAETGRVFGALPFLFKLLAAGRPLSIQAHPDVEAARAGWEREERQGIPLDAPNRNYRDANPKPELLCALGNFRALCGFRERRDIIRLLEIFCGEDFDPDVPGVKPSALLKNALDELKDALEGDDGLKDMLALLLNMDRETRRDLGVYSLAQAPQLEAAYPDYAGEWRITARLAELYPEDSGVLAPLYLNLVRLKSGEAIFLPPGVLHSYIEGFGVELQADSDNVLRGGLTAKHIDTAELLSILRFTPYQPAILQGAERPGAANWYTYQTSCREFSLSITQCRGEATALPVGPAIVLVTQGQARLQAANGEELALGPGESAFTAPGMVYLKGSFTAFAAGPGDVR